MKVETLDNLIAAVEAGTLTVEHRSACAMPEHVWQVYRYGSLDAAKRLHDALLPGWKWGRQWSEHMWVEPNDMPGRSDRYYGQAPNPARAWLLAILRAVKASSLPP